MGNNLLKPFSNWLYKISNNIVINAVRKGLTCMMPLFLIGAVAQLLVNLQIPIYQQFMAESAIGNGWRTFLAAIQQGTFQIVSVGALITVSYFIAKEKNVKRPGQVNMMVVLLVAVCCFFIMQNVSEGAIRFNLLGQTNLLLTIGISVLATSLFYFFSDHKLIKTKLFTDDADILFTQVLYVLEPAIWTILIFSLLKTVLVNFNITDLNQFIHETFQSFILPQDATLMSAVYYIVCLNFFWFLGVHGSAVMLNVLLELWYPQMNENIKTVAAGLTSADNLNIFNDGFFDVFVSLGGSGAILCLIIALLIKARKTNSNKIARFSLPMALFNISESLVYGLPIVFNPLYLIPFLFVPVVLVVISWLCMTVGLVPVAAARVHWTTPILISGFRSTGSIRGSLLQLFNLFVGTCMYLPFVAVGEKIKEKAHFKVLDSLNDVVINAEAQPAYLLLNRQDDIGYLARALAYDLKSSLNDEGNLFLMFQPQIDGDGNIYGCEALLRWKHQKFGFIPPPTVIAIAEEAGLHSRLNEWIFNTALTAQSRFKEQGSDQLIMSINISPLQLDNTNIPQILREAIEKYALDPQKIEVELTENVALNDSRDTRTALERYKELGVRLAIDDFSMGHTSIQYIRSFRFDTVKLDGTLVSDILTNASSRDIVKALVSLASSLDMHVIAEFVESEEQKDALLELGCRIYQGYLYSKPLPSDTFQDFMSQGKVGGSGETAQ